MNIIEAIKSGKRFRLPHLSWIDTRQIAGIHMLQLHVADIVSDDWEVESQAVTITREQLLDAYLAAGKNDDVKHGRIDLINAIAKELGL